MTTDSYTLVLSGSLPSAKDLAGLPGLRVIDIRLNSISGACAHMLQADCVFIAALHRLH